MASSAVLTSVDVLARCWVHEISRVFGDRLVNEDDRNWLRRTVLEVMSRGFKKGYMYEEIYGEMPIIFTDVLTMRKAFPQYQEI